VCVVRALWLACATLLAIAPLAQARTETLRWLAGTGSGDAPAGFILYAGISADAFSASKRVSLAQISGPDGGGIYSYSWTVDEPALDSIDIHFAIKAYDADDEHSGFSNSIVRVSPDPDSNRAPNGNISAPTGDLVLNVGAGTFFSGTASDPEGDDISIVWDFDAVSSGVPNATTLSPGVVTFDRAGTFIVSLTATDQNGLSDPTPDTVKITVVGVDPPPPGGGDDEPEPDPEPTPEGPGIQKTAHGVSDAVMLTAPEGDPRLFVVERGGVIRIVEGGAVRRRPFLDLRDSLSTGDGQGLLGLAFDPEFGENGSYFYTHRIAPSGHSVISRFRVSLGNPYEADRDSEEVVLEVAQPDSNNNGGHIAFGPDGFLYIGLGDGGGSHDPENLSQDGGSLLGKLLRIDVGRPFAEGSTPVDGTPYAIPSDNPFAGSGSLRNEIWALGLRNPSLFSFDRESGDLWIADQGEDSQEEINVEPFESDGGVNYGWDVVEGTICNDVDPTPSLSCNSNQITDPVYEYEHSESNCAIIGGFVYRGVIADFQGEYFFADACSGRIWSRNVESGAVTGHSAEFAAWADGGAVRAAGFGEDGVGELYLLDDEGRVYELRAEAPECSDGYDNDGDGLFDYPNDPGCSRASSTNEQPLCDDGFDNDRDGETDLDDPQCRNAYENIEATPSNSDDELVSDSLCGLGAEIAFLLPAAIWLRQRRRARRA
jgi:glucose/arabinose dehydrogenase